MAVVQGAQERRMVLHNVAWDTYARLLRGHANVSAPRFTYDRGTLEIMSPLPEHERFNRALQLLLPVIAEELGTELYSLGSTTFNREDLQRGFEPDSCFYIRNAPLVWDRDRIDLRIGPPPDLVVEIDSTHPSIDKLPIFAHIGVPEVWRYDGERLEILVLDGDQYAERARSDAFPAVTSDALASLLSTSTGLGDIAWLRQARDRARSLHGA